MTRWFLLLVSISTFGMVCNYNFAKENPEKMSLKSPAIERTLTETNNGKWFNAWGRWSKAW